VGDGKQLFLSHPLDGKKVEFFINKPISQKPLKTIIFVHGHQSTNPNGGYDFVKWKVLNKWRQRGFLAVAISQPGYGGSEGMPDFCGMYTQDAIIAVKKHLVQQQLADSDNITLLGISRGAMISGMVAARDRDIKNLVLIGGAYDLEALYKELPDGPLKRNIKREGGAESYQFRERSVLAHGEKIKARTLILHGKTDRRPTFKNAKELYEMLKISNVEVEFHPFESGHRIPVKERNVFIDKFLLGVP
tara:strand:+ start:226291 stop:227031 length:741 start_codon:yes stop_codon:yes gene_type:complete